jgi:hypothetical protein
MLEYARFSHHIYKKEHLMKNMQLLSCLFFATIATHCMESSTNPWKKIDCNAVEKSLNNDYHNYLKNRLEAYKTTDFTQQDMSNLQTMGNFITGKPDTHLLYNHIRDEQGDSFITIAVKKPDLPIVNWCTAVGKARRISHEDFNTCITTCMRYLSPKETNDSKRKNTYDILKRLTLKRAHIAIIPALQSKINRENLIKQLILLQLKHTKHNSNFVIEDELITQHLTSGENDQSPIKLTDIYQQVTDKKGNTLSHIIVNNQNPDELWELITKEYVSPLENKDQKTIVALALTHFQSFSQDATLFDVYPDQSKRAHCCLFMLLKYVKAKQTGKELSSFPSCCDKHIVKK